MHSSLSANSHCNSQLEAFLWCSSFRKQQFVYSLAWATWITLHLLGLLVMWEVDFKLALLLL